MALRACKTLGCDRIELMDMASYFCSAVFGWLSIFSLQIVAKTCAKVYEFATKKKKKEGVWHV